MGQELRDQRAIAAAIQRTASSDDRAPGSNPLPPAASASGSQPMETQLVMSAASRQRLLACIAEGVRDYIVASVDGRVSVRVRLDVLATGRGQQCFANGTVVVDWSSATIEHGNNRVSLTQTELRLMSVLLEADGHLVPRRALIAQTWPRADPSTRENMLGVYLCGLRKRLASIGLPNTLQTVRRAGYRLRLSAVTPPGPTTLDESD